MLNGFELYPRWVPLQYVAGHKNGEKKKEMAGKKMAGKRKQLALDTGHLTH